jgi:membrane protein
MNKLLLTARRLLRVLTAAGDRFYWDGGFSRAGSLAYSSLLSLVPALGLTFGMLASFAVSSQYIPEVRRYLLDHFVPVPETVDAIVNVLVQFSETLSQVQVPVILFIVITSIVLLNTIENTLNEVWQVYDQRGIANKVAIFCSILVIAPVSLISIFYFTRFRVEPMLAGFSEGSVFRDVYQFAFPIGIDFLAFLSLYTLVPKAPVRWRSACFGALVATALFAGAKGGFALYIESYASYSRLYGTLAVIPIFLIWLYTTWVIVILGAESAFQAQYLPESGAVFKRSLVTIGEGKFVLAIQLLVSLAESFRKGEGMPDEQGISEKLGCSNAILRPILDLLEKEGVVSRGSGGKMPLSLLKSPDSIVLHKVRAVLFGGHFPTHYPSQLAKFYTLPANAIADADDSTAELSFTLEDLLQVNGTRSD